MIWLLVTYVATMAVTVGYLQINTAPDMSQSATPSSFKPLTGIVDIVDIVDSRVTSFSRGKHHQTDLINVGSDQLRQQITIALGASDASVASARRRGRDRLVWNVKVSLCIAGIGLLHEHQFRNQIQFYARDLADASVPWAEHCTHQYWYQFAGECTTRRYRGSAILPGDWFAQFIGNASSGDQLVLVVRYPTSIELQVLGWSVSIV